MSNSMIPELGKKLELQLKSYEDNMFSLLRAHNIGVDQFMNIVVNSCKKTPTLFECDRGTLLGAVLSAAELGLLPNTPMGFSYIIPYNRKVKVGNTWESRLEAQFQIGYQGWLEIMYRNPRISDIQCGVVYEGDHFKFTKGTSGVFEHEAVSPGKRGEPIGAYALAFLKEVDKPKVLFLYREEIESYQKISKAGNSDSSPWKDTEKDPRKWMWMKTCIKQLAKEVPKTRETEHAYHLDTVAETGGRVTIDQETVVVEDSQDQKKERMESKGDNVLSSIKGMISDEKNG
jgi:recombination protein RecT